MLEVGRAAPNPSAPAVTLGLFPLGEPEAPKPPEDVLPERKSRQGPWIAIGLLGAGALIAAALFVRGPASGPGDLASPAGGRPGSKAPAELPLPHREPHADEPTAPPAPALPEGSGRPSEEGQREVEQERAAPAATAPRSIAPKPTATAARRPTRTTSRRSAEPAAPKTQAPTERASQPQKPECVCKGGDLLCAMKCATGKR